MSDSATMSDGTVLRERTARSLGLTGSDAATSQMLTDAEHRAMSLLGELWNLLADEVIDGPQWRNDAMELVAHIHAVQHAVMAQAAARAYPDRYRLLGDELSRQQSA